MSEFHARSARDEDICERRNQPSHGRAAGRGAGDFQDRPTGSRFESPNFLKEPELDFYSAFFRNRCLSIPDCKN